MDKITKREMFEALVNFSDKKGFTFERDGESYEVDMETLNTFASHEIEMLDKKAEKSKVYASKKKAANDALMTAVYEAMSTEDFESIPDIAARVEMEDATVGKVQYRLRKLLENGMAEKQEITIPGVEGSRSRKVQGYKKIEVSIENSDT